jgi:hypothetical protein
MVKYNYAMLQEYINQHNITLIGEYSKVCITTHITGKCITENCEQLFNKQFRDIIKTSGLCKKCTKITANEKRKQSYITQFGVDNPAKSKELRDKTKLTCLQKYGVDNPAKSPEIIDQVKKTCLEKYNTICSLQSDISIKNNLIRYGVEFPSQSQEIKDKMKLACLIKFGVEYATQSQEIKDKVKNTCLIKLGVEYPTQSEQVREKVKRSNIKNFGVEYPSQTQIVKDKMKQTNLLKFGVEYASQSPQIQDKIKNTCLERYGVEHSSQSQDVKDKLKETNILKYGVEHLMHLSDHADKVSKRSYHNKEYTFPSGKVITVQGYEPFGLDELTTHYNIDERDIITKKGEVPVIWYTDDMGKKHRHYVDIFIRSQNRCIEIKSTWTSEKKKDNIFLKQNAAKELGYLYEIWIYDSKGKKVEMYL